MKRTLFAIAFAGFGIAAAQAADIEPMPEAYDWSGPYIGLQAGYAWGDSGVNEEVPSQPEDSDSYDYDHDGFVGGAHLGYNHQSDSLVFGIEADGEYTDISGDQVFNASLSTDSTDKEIEWLASLRLRLGYAMDQALMYATGGVAVGGVDMEANSPSFGGTASESETAVGYTIGGGIEYALLDNLSARIEYRYTDLENTTQSTEVFSVLTEEEHENKFHAVRGGISWHF